MHTKKDTFVGHMRLSHHKLRVSLYFPPIGIAILHNIAFREILSASSIYNYECILFPFFSFVLQKGMSSILFNSDKSTDGFPVICYTDGSKIDGRVGLILMCSEVMLNPSTFNLEYVMNAHFLPDILCLNFVIKLITEQNIVISEYLICTESLY
ncbi:hypothetical protein TNCV_3800961 [Trichonephila clavipes]|nr:hypothetical protein TNCV_3800961 [Trichonephila clavipes]